MSGIKPAAEDIEDLDDISEIEKLRHSKKESNASDINSVASHVPDQSRHPDQGQHLENTGKDQHQNAGKATESSQIMTQDAPKGSDTKSSGAVEKPPSEFVLKCYANGVPVRDITLPSSSTWRPEEET